MERESIISRSEIVKPSPGMIAILTGSTAVGKTGTRAELIRRNPDRMVPVLNTTTRPPRVGEVEGVDMHFAPHEEFLRMVRRNAFIEVSSYRANLYGTHRRDVWKFFEGKDIVWVLPTSSALTIKEGIEYAYGKDCARLMLDRIDIFYSGVNRLFTLKERYLHDEKRDGNTTILRRSFRRRLREDWTQWKIVDKNRSEPKIIGERNIPIHIIFNEEGELSQTVDTIEDVINQHREFLAA